MTELPRNILVTGATSAVGGYLLPALTRQGIHVTAVSRRLATVTDVRWLQGELQAMDATMLLPEPGALVHLAPIFTLPDVLPALLANGRLQRVVALSSTSTQTRQNANSVQDRRLAQRLAESERSIAEQCGRAAVPYTILRPTLIYGGSPAGSLGLVRDLVSRFGLFPLAGGGTGLRQPVHAEDVAKACEQVLRHATTRSRIYSVPGGEVLTYREMLRRIFTALNRKPRLVSVPVRLLRIILACLCWLPGMRNMSPSIADRMNQDMIFDYAEAARDFGYAPRGFTGRV